MDLSTAALLIVILLPSGAGVPVYRETHEFPSMEMCLKAVETSHFTVSIGNESEGAGAMYCVPKDAK